MFSSYIFPSLCSSLFLLTSSTSTSPLSLSSTSTPLPEHKSRYITIHENELQLSNHFKVAYSHRAHGKLIVDVGDVTTSSIVVKWRLSDRSYNDSTIESTVLCETYSGVIISKKTVTTTGLHLVEGLESDSSYILCVYMLERAPQTNTTVLHFSCHHADTIPVLRADSIVGVLLTLGYIFLMAAIGYVVWKKKSREINEDKVRITTDEDEEEEEVVQADKVIRARPKRTKHITKATVNYDERQNTATAAMNLASTAKSSPDADGEGDRNGCLDFRKSRDSSSGLCDVMYTEMEDKKPKSKSRSNESSPIKVTEIAF